MSAIELGDKVRDQISGFEGIVIGITRWITGCDRAIVKPQTLHDHKTVDGENFDVSMLVVLQKAAVPPENLFHMNRPAMQERPAGGPRKEDPTR